MHHWQQHEPQIHVLIKLSTTEHQSKPKGEEKNEKKNKADLSWGESKKASERFPL